MLIRFCIWSRTTNKTWHKLFVDTKTLTEKSNRGWKDFSRSSEPDDSFRLSLREELRGVVSLSAVFNSWNSPDKIYVTGLTNTHSLFLQGTFNSILSSMRYHRHVHLTAVTQKLHGCGCFRIHFWLIIFYHFVLNTDKSVWCVGE